MKITKIDWEMGKRYKDSMVNRVWEVKRNADGFNLVCVDKDVMIEDVFTAYNLSQMKFTEIRAKVETDEELEIDLVSDILAQVVVYHNAICSADKLISDIEGVTFKAVQALNDYLKKSGHPLRDFTKHHINRMGIRDPEIILKVNDRLEAIIFATITNFFDDEEGGETGAR